MNHQKYQHTNHRNNFTDKEVEAHWDNVAHIYVAENDKVKATHDQRFHESMQHLEVDTARRVLNISSRDAEANDFIHNYNPKAEVVNAEISAGLMAEARKRRPEAVQQKIETYSKLPFADGFSTGCSASKPWSIVPIHWHFAGVAPCKLHGCTPGAQLSASHKRNSLPFVHRPVWWPRRRAPSFSTLRRGKGHVVQIRLEAFAAQGNRSYPCWPQRAAGFWRTPDRCFPWQFVVRNGHQTILCLRKSLIAGGEILGWAKHSLRPPIL